MNSINFALLIGVSHNQVILALASAFRMNPNSLVNVLPVVDEYESQRVYYVSRQNQQVVREVLDKLELETA